MNYTVIEGEISNLERTSRVSGGGNTMAQTTQVAIFTVGGARVMLQSRDPAMIASGDLVRLAGHHKPGQFTAVACRNLTTGWATAISSQGCVKLILWVPTIFGVLITILIPFFFIMPLATGTLLYLVMRTDANSRRAHDLIV